MAALSNERILELLLPYLPLQYLAQDKTAGERCVGPLSTFLDLLLRWNERTNLTAIREPEEIVRRHFGESLFVAWHLAEKLQAGATVLDFGSGAGFPGLPVQLYLPSLRVALAESQGKKAAFLREAVRTLGLTTEVWDQRVEAMPPARQFDGITMRAVDRMAAAVETAQRKLCAGGILAILTTESEHFRGIPEDGNREVFALPGTERGELHLIRSHPSG